MMNRSVMERQMFKDGGAAFPDLSGDGKITQKDILMGRGVQFMETGGVKMPSPAVEEANFLLGRFIDLTRDGTTGQLETFIRNNIANMEAAGLFQNRFVRNVIENVTGRSPEDVAAGGRFLDQKMVPDQEMVPMVPMGIPNPVITSEGFSYSPPERERSVDRLISQTPDEANAAMMMDPAMMAGITGAEAMGGALPFINVDPNFSQRVDEQNQRNMEMMSNLPVGKQEGGVIEPPMMDPAMVMDPAMMAGGSPAEMMMAEQQVMDAPPEIRQAAEEQVQAGLPMVENALNQFAMNTGGQDVENAQSFEEMMNMVRGFPATAGERREELAELVGPEDASQTPDSVLAMVQPVIGLTALDQGIGSLAREEMGEAPPMGGIMDMAAAPGGMMVEEDMPV